MRTQGISFSILRHSAWAPGVITPEAWQAWAQAPFAIRAGEEPGVKAMPAMLRRRAGFLGKMALEVAYDCLGGRSDVATVFCSRHGDVGRAVELLSDLARGEPLSPMAFGMAVHNAIPGLFSIARSDRANYTALASGSASVEHALIEACGLLADGAPMVLLVACDCPLPELFTPFEECEEQPHAWAWLIAPAGDDAIRLEWEQCAEAPAANMPGSLEVAAFHASGARKLERCDGRLRWIWSRDA
ncbi:beta-ketoacyl synthase chain length factor [Duganella sp. Root1480D1]|uniref:beta-ketoacyl synthase chain length factor n=1 Tax=Duganella sp. Root1480D1 TaxID=1736471 RepID=UPI00071012CB|nr:beta-ketoacyl synthase chain length factor [Duganella sp. Root1480D1]KQZ28178.1 3-oxoacyl-ACP synthase [Duganella sp. Root1480D1]